MKIEKTGKIKVVSPLTAEFVANTRSGDFEEDIQEVKGRELLPYESVIQRAVAQHADNLLCYYNGPESIKADLVSMVPSVENYKGELCGCTVIEYKQDLSEPQWNAVFDYLAGQYADGWGESFEQLDIKVRDGYLNVHFWQPEGFELHFIEIEMEKRAPEQFRAARPPMELMGHDGNIFCILGRAAKLLRENGQNAEAVEMRRRVTNCHNYYTALGIVSEYVETELSFPRDLPKDPARTHKDKGGKAR